MNLFFKRSRLINLYRHQECTGTSGPRWFSIWNWEYGKFYIDLGGFWSRLVFSRCHLSYWRASESQEGGSYLKQTGQTANVKSGGEQERRRRRRKETNTVEAMMDDKCCSVFALLLSVSSVDMNDLGKLCSASLSDEDQATSHCRSGGEVTGVQAPCLVWRWRFKKENELYQK